MRKREKERGVHRENTLYRRRNRSFFTVGMHYYIICNEDDEEKERKTRACRKLRAVATGNGKEEEDGLKRIQFLNEVIGRRDGGKK